MTPNERKCLFTVVGLLTLVALTFLCYLPVLRAGFIWDDDVMLTHNTFVRHPSGLYYIWCTTELPDYFPLASTSLWLEWRLWHMEPAGYHVTNVLLHIASVLLLWRILLRLGIPGAWLVALVFAVHPVNVESVAWIAERKNTLSMFFGLLSVLFFLKSQADNSQVSRITPETLFFYLSSLFAFLCALLSKTSVVMLPVVLLALAWWQHGRIRVKDLVRTLPFFALSLVLGVVTVWFQYKRAIGTDVVFEGNFLTRIANAGWALWFYLGKALWPANLSFVYARPTLASHWLVGCLLLIAFIGLLVLCWRFRNRWGRGTLLGLGVFALMLLPVLGFLNIYFHRYSLVADHWQYFALIGTVALVIGGAAAFVNSREARARDKGAWLWGGRLAGGLVVAALAVLSYKQTFIYHDDETLWRDTLRKNPTSWLALNNLGLVAVKKGSFTEAKELHLRSLEARPHQIEAHNNLGEVFLAEGNLAEAKEHYLAALKFDPNSAVTHYNLGNVADREGRSADAEAAYRRALELKPYHPEAHNNLGCLLAARGQMDDAIAHFNDALRARPDYPDALYNLGSVLVEQHRPAGALPLLADAIRLRPDYSDAYYNQGNAYVALRKPREAFAAYQAALKFNPRNGPAHYKLGNIYFEGGQFTSAAEQYQAALAISPNAAEPHYQLAVILAQRKETADVLAHYQAAVRLRPTWIEALNNLAWLRATHVDAKYRDGKQAVELATRAVTLTRTNDPGTLDTLAAAQAESGNWTQAVETAVLALSKSGTNNLDLRKDIQARLELFKAGRPFRE